MAPLGLGGRPGGATGTWGRGDGNWEGWETGRRPSGLGRELPSWCRVGGGGDPRFWWATGLPIWGGSAANPPAQIRNQIRTNTIITYGPTLNSNFLSPSLFPCPAPPHAPPLPPSARPPQHLHRRPHAPPLLLRRRRIEVAIYHAHDNTNIALAGPLDFCDSDTC